MISVVILTKNEEINLQRCLDSVSWSDDVLVLDSGSTDKTTEIARRNNAKVLFRFFDNFASQRNFAVDRGGLRHEWVLHLDADEEVTPQLRDELIRISSGRGDRGSLAYRVASRMMLDGRWIKRAGMYPVYQVRFGRVRDLRFKMVGHGQQEILEPHKLGVLGSDLIHHNFSKGVDDWLKRHEKYARDEAVEIIQRSGALSFSQAAASFMSARSNTERRRALKQRADDLPLRPLLRFLYVYVLRAGFLDGSAGLTYARLIWRYQRMIDQEVELLRGHVRKT